MQDVNSITLVGRLTRDPELRSFASGSSVATLRLAFTQSRKVDGNWTEEPGFIDVSVFGKQSETVSQYLSKGRQVVVQGRLDFRQWESEGQTRSALQIVANQVQFISSPGDSGQGQRSSSPPAQAAPAAAADDDIPF